MIIKKFIAENFRNIENCSIEFKPGVNLLIGDNAQGKTNAVEGIYMFARGKSFRAKEDKEVLKFGEQGFRIYIEYEDKNGGNSLEYIFYGRERKRKRNGYPIKSVKEMIGSFKAVLFYPDDLGLVKDSPEERRSFLNVALGQCYPVYVDYYSKYKVALENRNCLLKNCLKGNYFNESELDSWSESMAEYASHINLKRREYISRLEKHAKIIMREISDCKEELSLMYKSDVDEQYSTLSEIKDEYLRVFKRENEREKMAGITLFGVHRDDIDIMINGKSARSFSSQGQQRSIVLALKLAEGEVNREICGEYPVFLFDDVLSELDCKRKEYLLSGIGERQVIITSCENDPDKIIADGVIKVKDGDYKNVSSYR